MYLPFYLHIIVFTFLNLDVVQHVTTNCKIFQLNNGLNMGAVTAQWMHLRLPFCIPGFEFQAHHLHFYHLESTLSYICLCMHCENNKNKQKEAGFCPIKNQGPILKLKCRNTDYGQILIHYYRGQVISNQYIFASAKQIALRCLQIDGAGINSNHASISSCNYTAIVLWKNQFWSIGPRSVSAKKSGVHLSYLQRSALSRQSSETNDVAKVNRHGVECFSDHGVPLDQLASHRPGTKLKPVVKSKYFSFVKTHLLGILLIREGSFQE